MTHLLKISITHNKKRVPLLNLLINCIPIRSAPRILSIKGEYTCRFLDFLIIGLCNSSANSLLEIILLLIASPEVFFYQKIYKSLNQFNVDIHDILDF